MALKLTADEVEKQRERWRNDRDLPQTMAEYREFCKNVRARFEARHAELDKTGPSYDAGLKDLSLSEKEPTDVSGNKPAKAPFSELVSLEKQAELSRQHYLDREKELQTKEGRARLEAYEKEWNCVGYYDARKRLLVEKELKRGIDFGALLKIAEERKVKAEAESAKKPAGSSSKGKGKKK